MSRIVYILNGINLNDAGIVVKGNSGLIGVPEYKERMQTDFNGMNGVVIDTARPMVKAREITIDCAVVVDDITSVYQSIRATTNYGEQCQLLVKVGTSVLVYNVVCSASEPTKRWGGGKCICEFTITAIEAVPTKVVLKVEGAQTASVTFHPHGQPFDINWGDGTIDYDVTGTSATTKQHTYTESGTHYAVISGDVYQITNLTTSNCTVLWTIK